MKQSKQIPLRLTIDVLIVIVGIGLVAFGIVVASSRIFEVQVDNHPYAQASKAR
jgi:hypothetical protein